MDKELDLFNRLYRNDKKEIRKKYKFLGEGISRKVYAINNDYVVKLAKGEDGIYQNKIEYYVYSNSGDYLRKYLCPIVWFKPEMLIMRRAEPLSEYIKSRFLSLDSLRPEKNAVSDINLLTNKFLLDYEDIISTSSWGKLENTNVLIDYGCTSRIGDNFYDFLFLFLKM